MTFVDSTGKDLSRGATEKRAWVSGGRRARLLREFAVSGLCATRFAKLVGVKPVTFYAWLRKLSPVTSKCTTRGRIKMYHLGTVVFWAWRVAFGKGWLVVFKAGCSSGRLLLFPRGGGRGTVVPRSIRAAKLHFSPSLAGWLGADFVRRLPP